MRKQTMESGQNKPMPKARDLINANFYQVLASFAVVCGAIQIATVDNEAGN